MTLINRLGLLVRVDAEDDPACVGFDWLVCRPLGVTGWAARYKVVNITNITQKLTNVAVLTLTGRDLLGRSMIPCCRCTIDCCGSSG